MTFDRVKLFNLLRASFASKGLDTAQVSVVAALLDEFEKRKLTDLRWLAYMLATAWGECKWRPVREIGRGKGKPYGKIDKRTGHAYYGRGLVQLTWLANYQAMSKTTGIDLVAHPDRALEIPVAVQIMFEGMTTGKSAKDSFTKWQLHDFFNDKKNDPVGARRIINGTDKAAQFARWHNVILKALEATVRKAAPAPDSVTAGNVDAIRLATTFGGFDGGSVRVYGVK